VKSLAVILGVAVAVILRVVIRALAPDENVVDPFLVVAAVAGLTLRRVPSIFTGLLAGLVQDSWWSQWFGLHGFTKVSVAYAVAALGQRLDLGQVVPRVLVLSLATLADRALQLVLGAALDPASLRIPPPAEWLLAVLFSVILGLLALSVVDRVSRRR
jgi:rod shape-determining protein MreD